MKSGLVVYEDSPRYDQWVKVILGLVPAILLILGILIYKGVLPSETETEARTGSTVLFACTVFILLLFWAILPRRYQILEDRIRIVLGGPFSFDIPFKGIKTAKKAKGLAQFGIDFATSVNRIKIVRGRGMSVMISPGNQDPFLENLNKALDNWSKSPARQVST